MLIAATLAIPPQTKAAPVTDDYAGTKVTDDYRWLEGGRETRSGDIARRADRSRDPIGV